MAKLKELGRDKDTLVMFLSDHGTNFADNLEKAIGKPAGALYPGTMHIPLMMRHPEGKGAGLRLSPLVYTLDVPATVCAVAGPAPKDGVQGQSLIGLIEASGFEARDYLTCRYSNSVWYRDEKNWYFSNVHWENPRGCRWRTPEIPSEGYGTRSKRRSLKRSLMVVGGEGDSLGLLGEPVRARHCRSLELSPFAQNCDTRGTITPPTA